jgi:hypothetical protein
MRAREDPVSSANMSRIAVVAAALFMLAAAGAACSKSSGTRDTPKVAAPTGGMESAGAPLVPAPGGAEGAQAAPGARGNSDAFKLKPDEGQLSIVVPPDAEVGKETTARVVVTPSSKYKINFEFSTKLTLDPPADVTLAKSEFKAGGQAQVKGDAEKFEEKELAFSVKLTPTKSGTHTVNGTFKFAVCDKDACLAKKETIAFQLAAK